MDDIRIIHDLTLRVLDYKCKSDPKHYGYNDPSQVVKDYINVSDEIKNEFEHMGFSICDLSFQKIKD